MPIIIAHILEGRPKELKTALIRNLTDAVVKTLNADPEQVRVIISEMPKDQYGIGGKSAEELGR
ncbi:MAG: 2-hydroxymuconate tautomerase family protein [Ignavibacteriae bacterium]|jgi:4-oxalocrotonate tautomerase|nr:2-hydroxymuconate tautomerase family protein [Ignavibacteriota bacterium]